MVTKKKSESVKSAVKRAPKAKKTATEAKKAGGQSAKASAATVKTKRAEPAEIKTKPVGDRAPKRAAKAKATEAKTKKPAARTRKTKEKAQVAFAGHRVGEPVVDPIGDTTDGEGRSYAGETGRQAQVEMEAFRADTTSAAMDAGLEAGPGLEAAQTATEAKARKTAEDAARVETGSEESDELEGERGPRKPGKLERLQKILSQAGIASRRRAEEMIVEGRVMVNGQVVTQLGSKADAARDHIRVDGKLLHGAERHRYFMLNKPRGYVTTVSDPEGRPTVMQFFAKMPERLYPVGRLDFQSEGLLLMSNDGELANLLTKAESGVEKTYLVKVAGQPSEEELQRLRGGVAIEKGEAGSERVKTAPARIHQVRHGDNPWYEVVLTEGRNRELRKMFAAVGHFAEKIRRVGYGPLVLDVEPGKMRELSAEEVRALRLTAEGKMKPRRVKVDQVLPKEAGIPAEKRHVRGGKPGARRFDGARKDFKPHNDRPKFERGVAKGGRFEGRPAKTFGARPERGPKPEWKPWESRGEGRRIESGGERREFRGGPRREQGDARGAARFGGERKPFAGGKPRFGNQREGQRSFGAKPRFDRPRFEKRDFGGTQSGSGGAQREGGKGRFDSGARRPFKPQGERPKFERGDAKSGRFEGRPARTFEERGTRPQFGRSERPKFERSDAKSGQLEIRPAKSFGESGARPQFGRSERPKFERGGEGKRQFEGGKSKGFGKGATFGAKPGGFGQSRGQSGGGRKFGGARPGGRPFGGRKRG